MSDARSKKMEEVLQRQHELMQKLLEEKELLDLRTPCSRTIADMMIYMDKQTGQDRLIEKLSKPVEKTPQEKGKCSIL